MRGPLNGGPLKIPTIISIIMMIMIIVVIIIYIYICILYIICIYIYICRERERERDIEAYDISGSQRKAASKASRGARESRCTVIVHWPLNG